MEHFIDYWSENDPKRILIEWIIYCDSIVHHKLVICIIAHKQVFFAAIYESEIAVTVNPEITFRLRKGAHLPYIMPNPGFYSSLGGDMFDGYFFLK